MEKENFIMLPNKLVWNYKEGREGTYIYEYGNYIAHILSYIDCCRLSIGTYNFNLVQMISLLGLKVDSHKGKSIDQFKEILKDLNNKNILELECLNVNGENISIDKIKPQDMITSKILHIPFSLKDDKKTEFFMLNRNNYLKIINSDSRNKINLLVLYCYIISRVKRKKIKTYVNGGKAESFTCKLKDIENHLDMSINTITKTLKELNKMKFIYYANIGQIYKNGEPRMGSNVYALDENELEYALEESNGYYSDEGWSKTKEVSKKTLTLRSLKGVAKRLENKGKDISNVKERIEQLQNELIVKDEDTKNGLYKILENKIDEYDRLSENDDNAYEYQMFEILDDDKHCATEEDIKKAIVKMNSIIETYKNKNTIKKHKGIKRSKKDYWGDQQDTIDELTKKLFG